MSTALNEESRPFSTEGARTQLCADGAHEDAHCLREVRRLLSISRYDDVTGATHAFRSGDLMRDLEALIAFDLYPVEENRRETKAGSASPVGAWS